MEMDGRAIYEIWAPAGCPWADWVKPVLFGEMRTMTADDTGRPDPVPELRLPWLRRAKDDAALVVNLPGVEAMYVALYLAQAGFRPVPLYNTHRATNAAIDVDPIVDRLFFGTNNLRQAALPLDAPPAFILDAKRTFTGQTLSPGVFDNRWLVFPQDFPSASHLKEHGRRQVILVQRHAVVQDDLAHVLLRWQRGGLGVHLLRLGKVETPQPLTVRKPSFFRQAWHRTFASIGFRRNAAGGFGGRVPEPSSGGSGFG